MTTVRRGPAPLVEGDSNRSPQRQAFGQRQDPAVRALVEADARHFLHLALSSRASRRSAPPRVSGSRTSPGAATSIFTAIMCITSATVTRV
jgi:hypothetical protein